jgi:hypothetical protein
LIFSEGASDYEFTVFFFLDNFHSLKRAFAHVGGIHTE